MLRVKRGALTLKELNVALKGFVDSVTSSTQKDGIRVTLVQSYIYQDDPQCKLSEK